MLKNKLKKFGTTDAFREHYVSREARKLLKEGKTVSEVRKILNAPEGLPEVPVDILYRLKLIKTSTRRPNKDTEEARKRKEYLNSREFKEKMKRIRIERETQSYADWVEENTGVGRERGGTCIRPDIFLTWNNKACDSCPYYEHCVCHNKRLSHEPRKKRKR